MRKVSYTQYSMWMNCPTQWKLAYVDKLKPDDVSIHLTFGTSIHLVIQEWLETLYNKGLPKAKLIDLQYRFKEILMEQFKKDTKVYESGEKLYPCDLETFKEFYLDGCEILSYLRKNVKTFFPTAGYELVGCEIPLDLEVAPQVKYIGFIDIVVREKKTGKTIIYDLKTSGKGWYYEKKDPKKINQLLLYKHFYSTTLQIPLTDIDVKFIILKRKPNPTNPWDKRIVEFSPTQGIPSVKKAVDSFNDFLSIFDENGEVFLDKITCEPDKNKCRFCPFKNTEHCPASISLIGD